MNPRLFALIFFQWACLISSHATTLVLPSYGDVVGKVHSVFLEPGETIEEIGKRFDVGYYELLSANPHIRGGQNETDRMQLIIPSQFILPDVPRKGIVINLAEYRLYYFPENENIVLTFPVGIGRKGWKTPLGLTKIVSKVANPKWRPTEKLRQEASQYGDPLPDEFPSGPYNPLGKYAMRLGWPTFLIHGSNKNAGIGTPVSAGCIRMYSEDIEELFHLVPVGTQVRIINEPVKIGRQKGGLVLQMHSLLSEKGKKTLYPILEKRLNRFNVVHFESNKMIQSELAHPSGLVKNLKQ